MKYYLLFILIWIKINIYAQWTEDFSTNTLAEWSGDTSQFIINSGNQLQLNASNAGKSFIYRTYKFDKELEWSFYFQMKFAPSSTNKLRVYVLMNSQNVQNFEGYFFEIGENGTNDNWKFYARKNNSSIMLGQGEMSKLSLDPSLANFHCRLKNDSTWIIEVDYTGSRNYTEITEIKDSIKLMPSNSIFGIECEYTSTRIDKFYFDDISVQSPGFDTIGPKIVSISNIDKNQLLISFDEELDTNTSLKLNNYTIVNFASPVDFKIINTKDVILIFNKELISGQTYELIYQNVFDVKGNNSGKKLFQFIAQFSSFPKSGEILINEFMCDPEPSIALPKTEYIELYNNSDYSINLIDCKISDGSSISSSFPNYILHSNSYVILCANKDSTEFKKFGNTLGINSMPSLNNDGDQIILYDRNKEILDQVTYTIDWYKDKNKEDGGYSLELYYPKRHCQQFNVWAASQDPAGGTPGQKNSYYDSTRDDTKPEIISVIPISEWEVKILFNKVLDINFMTQQSNYKIEPNISIASIELVDPGQNEIILLLNGPLIKGLQYELQIEVISDCSLNVSKKVKFLFELAAEPLPGDLLFNEILFNPVSGGEDFIEFYNQSKKLIVSNNLYLRNKTKDLKWIKISSEIQIPSHSYFALTVDPKSQVNKYPTNDSLRIYYSQIPTLDDKFGSLELSTYQNHEFIILDSIDYSDTWHNSLISDYSGVSLEKINPDWTSDNKSHWTSATKISGYGTPGTKNSQTNDSLNININQILNLDTKIISPNGDGYRDFLKIQIQLDKPGYKSDIKIYSLSGELIKVLYQSIVAINEIITWQGDDDLNRIVTSGNYILQGSFIHPEGDKKFEKQKIIVVSGK